MISLLKTYNTAMLIQIYFYVESIRETSCRGKLGLPQLKFAYGHNWRAMHQISQYV